MRWRGRRGRGVVALVTGAVIGLGAVVLPSVPASAEEGLAETGTARYVVSENGAPIQVRQVLTLTNFKASTGSSYYYLNSYGLWLPNGATHLKATSNGSSLSSRVVTHSGQQYADLSFPSELRYGQTRTITVTYAIAGAPPRSARPGRVGKGYAAFDVYSPGDSGRATIQIVAPRWMTLDLGLPSDDSVSGDIRTTTARGGGSGGLWSLASLRDSSQVAKNTVTVGANEFTVYGFPGDTLWSRHITKNLPVTLPVLERVAGQPWPSRQTTVTEDFSGEVYGWDGRYDKGQISVSEALDPALLAHELAHAYANYDVLDERWLTEGLAQEMATEVTTATRQKDREHPNVRPTQKGAFPLTDWPDGYGVATSAEAYGYPASWRAVHALMGGSVAASRPAVIRALTTKGTVYDVPGEAKAGQHPTTWKQAYDVFEVVGGNKQTSSLMRTWVIGAQDAKLLASRTTWRAAYAAQDRLDGAWAQPRGVREAMAEWDFAGAARQLALTKDLAAPAMRVQAEAAEQGIDAAALRTAYQSADESSEYREVGAQLATFLRQVGSYASLRSDLGSADVVTRLGGAVVGSSGAVADAKAAIEDGDVPTADDALASARSRLDLASWAGLAIVLVALLLVVGAAVATWLTTRRRRPEAPVVPVISGGYVGYEGHDGYDGHDGHEGHDGHDGHTPVEATPDHESQSADPTAGAFEPSGSS